MKRRFWRGALVGFTRLALFGTVRHGQVSQVLAAAHSYELVPSSALHPDNLCVTSVRPSPSTWIAISLRCPT